MYTRFVRWRNRIAALVLFALTSLPVGATMCAMRCDAGSSPASHHSSAPNCEEQASRASGPQLSDVSEHHCSTHDSTHDATIRRVTTTLAPRLDSTAMSLPGVARTAGATLVTVLDPGSAFHYTAPPGTASPTTTLVVLRV